MAGQPDVFMCVMTDSEGGSDCEDELELRMTPKATASLPQPCFPPRASRKSTSTWYTNESDGLSSEAPSETENQTTTASDREREACSPKRRQGDSPKKLKKVSPRKGASPNRRSRGARKSTPQTDGKGRRVAEMFCMFGGDSSEGETGFHVDVRMRDVNVELFRDDDDDWFGRPGSPGNDLQRSTGMPGFDLSERRRASLGGQFARSRRRHSAPQARKRASSNPAERRKVFEPLPRTQTESKAKTTDDAELMSVPINSSGDLEHIAKDLSRSDATIPKKSDYDCFLDVRQINPYDNRDSSYSRFEKKVVPHTKADVNFRAIRGSHYKQQRKELLSTMVSGDQFAEKLHDLFMKHGSSSSPLTSSEEEVMKRKRVIVIRLSKKYYKHWKKAQGLDDSEGALEGGCSAVMELVGDLKSGALSVLTGFSSLWG